MIEIDKIVRDTVEELSAVGCPDAVVDFAGLQVRSAAEIGFRAGFEHAVAGGEEAAKQRIVSKECLPLVLYFQTEADRREMIDAIESAKPGMVEYRIPERQK